MAKTKATKTVKRWVTRESGDGGWYMLFVGPKPRRRKGTWDTNGRDFVAHLCPSYFESFCPKYLHLKPNGGPIEIRIVKVKAVKP